MAYVPAAVTSAGLTIPPYADILAQLLSLYLQIYGQNCYLGQDSPDYQDIAVRALQAFDANSAMQVVYLGMNPRTAIGQQLDLLGVLIGTARKTASYSTALVTLVGVSGTQITNGLVSDTNDNLWMLPGVVTIPNSGTVNVTATAQQIGNITANPGAINQIATPTAGWLTVTNAAGASPGQPVEVDSAYRARLLVSQALPSQTIISGTAAALAAVPGVTRSRVYENTESFSTGWGVISTSGTNVTLIYGFPFDSSMIGQTINIGAFGLNPGTPFTIATVPTASSLTLTSSAGSQLNVPFAIGNGMELGPAHSISAVVEGGTGTNIAAAIYNNKGVGCYTNGSSSVVITDANNGNISQTVRYSVLGYFHVIVTAQLYELVGYTTAVGASIIASITAYLAQLGIGVDIAAGELYGAALSARADPDNPTFTLASVTVSACFETTATLTSSTTITVADASGITTGATIAAATGNFPPLTQVVTVSGLTITLSLAALVSGTGVPVAFSLVGNGAVVQVPWNEAATAPSGYVQLQAIL